MIRKSGTPRGLVYSLLLVLPAAIILAGCDSDPQERLAKQEALARWQDQRLAPQDSLQAMLDDRDAHVRLAALRAAGLIGRDDVLPRMLGALADPSVTVRAEAAWSLGLLGSPEAVPYLEEAAADPRPAVRLAALAALGQVQNRGQALMVAGVQGDAADAALAWDGLRNMAAFADRQALLAAIQAGLTRPEADVRWRVLRCCEQAADSSLAGLVAPFARAREDQVRVHAYRCLARLEGPVSLAAVREGFASHDRFRGRLNSRVTIAGCRALGALGPIAVASEGDIDPAPIAALLITAAGHDDPHVAATALTAMNRMVEGTPLPPEAAAQESLLPVWRIRMARSARSHVDSPHTGVRAAALGALAAVRGAGAAPEILLALQVEDSPAVLAAGLRAYSRHDPDPAGLLVHCAEIDFPNDFGASARPALRHPLVREAAYEGLAFVLAERPETLGQPPAAARLESHLYGGLDDEDPVIASICAELVAGFPCTGSLSGLIRLWDRASGPFKSDMRLGVLAGLAGILGPADGSWQAPDSLMSQTAGLLRRSFDAADIRIRLEGRETALVTGLLPEHLIPSEASLRATMPAVVRSPLQPPVRLPFDAPRVRCTTPRGEFIITLNGEIAPNTCAVFLDLIGAGFYDDLTFHRVVPDFVVQGGDPRGDGWGGPGYTIRSEWSRAPYKRAAVGIAHSGKDTGGSQFFITLSEQPHLDGRYTLFGEVTRGMEVVDRMEIGDRFRLEVIP